MEAEGLCTCILDAPGTTRRSCWFLGYYALAGSAADLAILRLVWTPKTGVIRLVSWLPPLHFDTPRLGRQSYGTRANIY
jgi:hypothetical protein